MTVLEPGPWFVASLRPGFFWRLIGPERLCEVLGVEDPAVGLRNYPESSTEIFFTRPILEKVANYLVAHGKEWFGEDLLEGAAAMVVVPDAAQVEGARVAEQIALIPGSWWFAGLEEASARRVAKVLGMGRAPGSVALFSSRHVYPLGSGACVMSLLHGALEAAAPVEASATVERLGRWLVGKHDSCPNCDNESSSL